MKLYALLFAILPSISWAQCPDWLDTSIHKLHSSDEIQLCNIVKNNPVLIINTASHCGYTKQFSGLEKLHQSYKDKGLVVIGFPSNSFNQEASNEAQTASICYKNFGVSFVMSKPISVKGTDAHPIFEYLNSQQGEPRWNFNKYLVNRQGDVIKRYESSIQPNSAILIKDIEAVL